MVSLQRPSELALASVGPPAVGPTAAAAVVAGRVDTSYTAVVSGKSEPRHHGASYLRTTTHGHFYTVSSSTGAKLDRAARWLLHHSVKIC